MTHCIIEYAKEVQNLVEPETLVEAVHQAIESTAIFDTKGLCTRMKSYDHYQVSNQRQKNALFIHITIWVEHGFSELEKTDLSIDVVAILQLFEIHKVMVSCDVLETSEASHALLFVG